MATVGENIKKIRIEKGLTQEALGKKCKPQMADSAIRRYESGKVIPKLETIQRIADGLDTAISNILTGEHLLKHPISEKELDNWRNTLPQTKTEKINMLFQQLNNTGKDKAIEQVELLTKIPEYTE